MEQKGEGSGISDYPTGLSYTDVPDFSPNQRLVTWFLKCFLSEKSLMKTKLDILLWSFSTLAAKIMWFLKSFHTSSCTECPCKHTQNTSFPTRLTFPWSLWLYFIHLKGLEVVVSNYLKHD